MSAKLYTDFDKLGSSTGKTVLSGKSTVRHQDLVNRIKLCIQVGQTTFGIKKGKMTTKHVVLIHRVFSVQSSEQEREKKTEINEPLTQLYARREER